MEDSHSTFEFLNEEESESHFAHCDFALRSGRHIQNHYHEAELYHYLTTYYESLQHYYFQLFGMQLRRKMYQDEVYYFLDFDGESRGKFGSSRSDRLSQRHTLFGLLLLKIHRVDHHFGTNVFQISTLKEELKEDKQAYRDDIYRLFARVANKHQASETDERGIDEWIENSLKKFSDLGWIYFEEDGQNIVILPSFDRLFSLYQNEINNLDTLLTDKTEEQNP